MTSFRPSPYAKHILKAYACWFAGGLLGAHRHYLKDTLGARAQGALLAFCVLLTGGALLADAVRDHSVLGHQVGPIFFLYLLTAGVALRDFFLMPWIVREDMTIGALRPAAQA